MSISMLLLALAFSTSDLIAKVMESYNSVQSYQVTLRSRNAVSEDVIRYYYKKPGLVRMEFVHPHKGAVLVYDPSENKVRLRPFDHIRKLILTLKPDNSLIKSPTGHRVDESDLGELLKAVKTLNDKGEAEIVGEEDVGGKPSVVLKVKGAGKFAVNGVHTYLLWIDKKGLLPVKASSYDESDALVEEVLMDDLETNVELENNMFNL